MRQLGCEAEKAFAVLDEAAEAQVEPDAGAVGVEQRLGDLAIERGGAASDGLAAGVDLVPIQSGSRIGIGVHVS